MLLPLPRKQEHVGSRRMCLHILYSEVLMAIAAFEDIQDCVYWSCRALEHIF